MLGIEGIHHRMLAGGFVRGLPYFLIPHLSNVLHCRNRLTFGAGRAKDEVGLLFLHKFDQALLQGGMRIPLRFDCHNQPVYGDDEPKVSSVWW